ncbi:hypothetical protein A2U01_0032944 [Trifolium medium]|uniref:Uncharacterized protein n=1 Tax=Trifolium medium TaxID=97028 RepID=A0A392PJ83_9FABA|nr:hypothetical protein [Trifolium medium]
MKLWICESERRSRVRYDVLSTENPAVAAEKLTCAASTLPFPAWLCTLPPGSHCAIDNHVLIIT